MGTQTLGSTSTPTGGTYFIDSGASDIQIKSGTYYFMPSGGGYVDHIYAYAGAYGSTQGFQFSLYTDSGNQGSLINGNGPFNYGTTIAWIHGDWTAGNYTFVTGGYSPSASLFVPGGGSSGLQVKGTGSGSFWWHQGSGWVTPATGFSQISSVGDFAWYITYFPPASISSYPSVVQPGSSFSVSGVSFSAGVNSININGVACPSWTVNSDTSLTITAPSTGTQGLLEVVTNAGNAYSSGNMIVGQVWVNRSGIASPIAIYIPNGSGVQQVKGVWVPNGSGGAKRIW